MSENWFKTYKKDNIKSLFTYSPTHLLTTLSGEGGIRTPEGLSPGDLQSPAVTTWLPLHFYINIIS